MRPMGPGRRSTHGGAMETTLPPPPTPPAPPSPPTPAADDAPDRSRAGAIWVTGTGAFLLLAAAAVFVAVQWEHLSDNVKLGILGALTGGFLLAGRRIRRDLPGTGGVLFHLGALLIPFNVATVAIHAEIGWSQLLLLEGAVATIAWVLLDRVEPSSVLRWAAGGAFVVAVAGAAGWAGIPTPLVLAAAAAIAQLRRAHTPALGWALTAGLGPVIVFAETWVSGSDVTGALGLTPTTPGLAWVVSGAVTAMVIARESRRRGEPLLIVPAGAALALGIAATWSILDPSAGVDLLGAAALFLAVELAAGLTRRDPFWRGPAHAVAVGAEVVGILAAPLAVLATTWWFVDGQFVEGRALGVAALVTAAAWLTGDLRRVIGARSPSSASTSVPSLGWSVLLGSGWWPASLGLTVNIVLGVAVLSGSSMAAGAAMVVLAALFVLSGRPTGHAWAVVLAILAPLAASTDVLAHDVRWSSAEQWFVIVARSDIALVGIAAIASAGALLLAAAAVVRARLADPGDNVPLAWALAVAALVPVSSGALVIGAWVPALAVLVGAATAAWAVALVLDRAAPADGRRGIVELGAVGRVGALLTLVGASTIGTRGTVLLAGLLTAAIVADAARRRSEALLLGLSVTLPVLVGAGGADLGLTIDEIGVVLAMLAAVAAGAHLLMGDRRGWPLLGVVFAAGTAGFGLAATAPTSRWLAVLVLAGIGAAYSTVHQSPIGGAASGLTAIAATWGLLIDGRVEAFDAYLAPVALVLVVAGGLARRSNRVSSWVAYGPAIILLGGSALYERLAGGGGVHALAAGAVAVLAVVVGGSRRLAAPLLLGTALLVALTAHESLSVTRQVPTWGWLALGGTALVAAGIAMERRDTNPMETGRRLVDVVGTRFH